jgi:hypothetical protein
LLSFGDSGEERLTLLKESSMFTIDYFRYGALSWESVGLFDSLLKALGPMIVPNLSFRKFELYLMQVIIYSSI